jgi:hypothetical protein
MSPARNERDSRCVLLRLYIGNRGTLDLCERLPRFQEQCSEEKICQRKHHVEILPHIPVVEHVVPVQLAEDSPKLDASVSRQVHAPMRILVRYVVADRYTKACYQNCVRFIHTDILPDESCNKVERDHSEEYDHGAVPPRHRNLVLRSSRLQVVTLIGPEYPMMGEGVCHEGISKYPPWHMHHVFVKTPLQNGGTRYANRQC